MKKPNKNIKPSKEIDGDSYELLMALENGEEFKRSKDYKELMDYSKKLQKTISKKMQGLAFVFRQLIWIISSVWQLLRGCPIKPT